MAIQIQVYQSLLEWCTKRNVTLVAVSKTKPSSDIMELYELGHRDFGENYVQELVQKQAELPKDIRWHFIGHLQRNKVKYIAPFVHLIHGVDSEKLLKEINKEGGKHQRVIPCLLQVHIAQEETKFGFDSVELTHLFDSLSNEPCEHVFLKGMMGMASFSNDMTLVRKELKKLKELYDVYQQKVSPPFSHLSMGMSGDYEIAVEEGSNMIRIGSMLFGARG